MELIVLLYKGAIKELQLARRHLQANATEPRVAAINKALAIIGELKASLDFKAGGSIAVSLDRLYNYMTQRLTTANLKREDKGIEEVIKLLETLLPAWEGARSKLAAEQARPSEPHSLGGIPQDRISISGSGAQGLHLAY